jgi:glycosidase
MDSAHRVDRRRLAVGSQLFAHVGLAVGRVGKARRWLALAAPLALAALTGCAADATNAATPDVGAPPDAFVAGDGGVFGDSGYGGYGDGGGADTATNADVDAAPVCPDAYKTCPHEITFPAHGETSVEVRGDWSAPDSWATGVPMTLKGSVWSAMLDLPLGKAIQFKFVLNGSNWQSDPAQPTVTDASGNTNNTFAGEVCAAPGCHVPPPKDEWRNAVIYYLFVDRFNDSNPANNCPAGGASAPIADFMGGDWAGVTKKIKDGYFTDLGVNTLMISSPVETVPNAEWGRNEAHKYTGYHGYWPKDFDPAKPFHCLGTAAELKELVDTAHANGLRVMFDLVMMHAHKSSPQFAAHNDWFWTNGSGGPIYFCDENGGGNWETWSGDNWDGTKPGTRCWFTDYLPHWNFTNKGARDFFVGNTVDWVKAYGIDGFRLDAVKHVDVSVLKDLRAALTSQILPTRAAGSRFFLVGENFEPGSRPHLRWHVDPKTMLDGNYEFVSKEDIVSKILRRQGSMSDLKGSLDYSDGYFPVDAIMTPFFGSQDTPRAIHAGQDSAPDTGKWATPPGVPADSAYERLAVAFAVLLTNKGAPLIYYGDEFGMPGADDPDNRRMMLWSGLTTSQSTLKAKVSKMLKVRAAHKALWAGSRATLDVQQDLWVYSQSTTGDTVYVALNRSDSPQSTTKLPAGTFVEQLTGTTVTGPNDTIPARSARIYVAK